MSLNMKHESNEFSIWSDEFLEFNNPGVVKFDERVSLKIVMKWFEENAIVSSYLWNSLDSFGDYLREYSYLNGSSLNVRMTIREEPISSEFTPIIESFIDAMLAKQGIKLTVKAKETNLLEGVNKLVFDIINTNLFS